MKYIDIHSHLNFPEFSDLEDAIQRLKDTDTGTIVVGTDLESSRKAVELADKHSMIWACIGVHPVDDPSKTFDPKDFEELVEHPKVVAIGECGLDFFHAKKEEDLVRQKSIFLSQVDFAIAHDLPIMIHSRSAYPEQLAILEDLKKTHGDKLRGDVHFFAGNLEEAKRFWEIDFATSFTGVITFARNYDDVIKNAPLDMLMSETDSPFVAPVPYRGKRNEPSYVVEIVKKIAELREEKLEVVEKALISNVQRLFKLELDK